MKRCPPDDRKTTAQLSSPCTARKGKIGDSRLRLLFSFWASGFPFLLEAGPRRKEDRGVGSPLLHIDACRPRNRMWGLELARSHRGGPPTVLARCQRSRLGRKGFVLQSRADIGQEQSVRGCPRFSRLTHKSSYRGRDGRGLLRSGTRRR